DAHHRLSVPALAGLLQEVAWEHSVSRGVDLPELLKYGLSWVLSRMRIEVETLPVYRQTVRLDTWVSAIDRYFYYREFRLTDAVSGQLLLRASSVWGVLDVARRRVVPVPDFILRQTPIHHDTPPVPPSGGKLRSFGEAAFSASIAVTWPLLDANQHVNNTQYIAWLVQALPAEWLQHHTLTQLDVQFRAEATLGDHLFSEAVSESPTGFLHRVRRPSGQELVQARSGWRQLPD
ncbi:MAG: acyl-ACP thioesterase, partial [Sphingobacteriaceae bacterium]|nr:acyl-ACP thioesterase [Cytophagaceae bacterium]